MNYDVPREPGFYWVDWGGKGKVEPVEFRVELLGEYTHEPWVDKTWWSVGSDIYEYEPPERVLCRCEMPADDGTFWGIYKRLAKMAQDIDAQTGRLDITGPLVDLTIRATPKRKRKKVKR